MTVKDSPQHHNEAQGVKPGQPMHTNIATGQAAPIQIPRSSRGARQCCLSAMIGDTGPCDGEGGV